MNKKGCKKVNLISKHIKKDKSKKFATGQSRYCQKCGVESAELFEVTKNIQKKDQLLYCSKCKNLYKAKKEVDHKHKTILV